MNVWIASIIEIEEMGMFQGLLSFKVELAASESMFLFEWLLSVIALILCPEINKITICCCSVFFVVHLHVLQISDSYNSHLPGR